MSTIDPFVGLPGELIIGSDGRWLGDFAAEYVVPADSTRFSLLYPVGWTNCGWFETVGCDTARPPFGCECSDCCNNSSSRLPPIQANFFGQRYPDQVVDPCLTKSALDGWGIAIAPKHCKDGCGSVLIHGLCCCTHPCDTIRCGSIGNGLETPAGWPLTVYGAANPSTRIKVVSDDSGPAGIESMNAMEIDFSGSGAEGATFVGEGGGYDDKRPPFTNSNPDPQGTSSSITTARSANLWTVAIGDCIRLTAWVKAVPDRYGNTCIGYPFSAKITSPIINAAIPATFKSPIILDGSWQYLDCTYTNFAVGTRNVAVVDPMITLMTTHTNSTDPRTACAEDAIFRDRHLPLPEATQPPRGRVHVKAVHLTSCSALYDHGAHVWKRY